MDLSGVKCPTCKGPLRDSTAFPFTAYCVKCRELFPYKGLRRQSKHRPKRSRGQRDSKRQECKLASSVKGRRHRASGADWKDKSDVSERTIRYECKTTRRQSISIRRSDLRKIADEAILDGQVPILHLQFEEEGAQAVEEYFVLRRADFESVASVLRWAAGEDSE